MKKFLVIGDPHVTADELSDCEKLMEMVHEVADRELVDAVVVLGDLHHNHSLVHVDVTDFWLKHLTRLASHWPSRGTMVLVGNHDRSTNDSAPAHALEPYRYIEGVQVIDAPRRDSGVGFVPYIGDNDKFVEECRKLTGVKTLFCHQTFDGTKFENGFYAKGAIDAGRIPQETVISGHIHLQQQLGKVWYPGAPRWRTLSDANVDRAIWVVELSDDGTFFSSKSYSTGSVCRQIRHTVLKGGELIDGPPIDDTDCRWHIDLKGSREQNRALAAKLGGPGRRIRPFDEEDSKSFSIKESEGVATSFWKFLEGWQPAGATSKEVLGRMARERLGWS